MAVAFSCEHFPDLWDMVIAHTDHGTQLALRLVCKSLRFKIDCFQSRYLVISEGGDSAQLIVTGPSRHIPYFDEQAHIHNEPGFWLNRPTVARVAHTRVLDIQGYCPPSNDPDLFTFMHFPALEVLRMTPSVADYDCDHFTPYVPEHFHARTLVLFSNPMGCRAMDKHWWFFMDDSDDEDSQALVPYDVDRSRLPRSVTKLVLNMRGLPTAFPDMYPFVSRIPSHVREVVANAPYYQSLDDRGSVHFEVSAHIEQIHLLAVVFRTMSTRFTCVGFDRLASDFADKFMRELESRYRHIFFNTVDYTIEDELTLKLPDETRAEYIECSTSGVRRGKQLPRNPDRPLISLKEQVDQLVSRVEFITKVEYVERVGRETAELDLLEHPDPDDRACVGRKYNWRRREDYGDTGMADYWHQMRASSE
ncbi:hypothetical protein A1Q1_03274 [Trichosporon asahii var. asahii CBS 2479]|uniref:Uncharacterized protein n=1 Tax=Trichosporon asahii var. asahii (strain ATCC 90039 / CBS 2479 / JCM 2466 / KCTC 7840 / NBRC 103889/ NCYC 2677 / UAMH 7654) TaxID=1186058 RepID=J5QKD9_TRIAS|nr:hypothetical protein A1Q1_03274 [Trichosporon asahii var. asahii CBS 2479]EJT47813.1 hypothetical protein A1Q1_03274 [Trichosporon asahii var. asahii CBS 2479]